MKFAIHAFALLPLLICIGCYSPEPPAAERPRIDEDSDRPSASSNSGADKNKATHENPGFAEQKAAPTASGATSNDLIIDGAGGAPTGFVSASAADLEAQRKYLDETLWKPEVEAQRYEQAFIDLWDGILAVPADKKSRRLAEFPLSQLIYSTPSEPESLTLGIRRWTFAGDDVALQPQQWQALVSEYEANGYRLEEVEFHHSKFVPAGGDAPPSSVVSFLLHVARHDPPHRAVVRGNLRVQWTGKSDSRGRPLAGDVRVADLVVVDRRQGPVFEEVLRASSNAEHPRVMPLIARDLDGDGLSEIILGGLNRVYQNLGGGKFEARTLLEPEVDMFDAAIVEDFTGDGHVDLICVGRDRHPTLCPGDGKGGFRSPGFRCAEFALELPKSFTAGDIDGDGDLDLFIGQYKFPYTQGAMPTPFYDANDGFPAVMLENDGQGRFTDVTQAAGLAAKRNRRTFSSSLFDYDEDGDLDLLVVSDFAGVDLYENDGTGQFTDITEKLIDEPHHFGMAHTFGDYNLDGRLDMYVIGMSSTTARRLDLMKLNHPDHPDINRHRAAMGYGNRLFQWEGDRFEQPAWRNDVARTGWSWGTTTFDFDNDGDRDIYVVNGHNSGRSTQDYCTRYWCHDVYTGSSQPDLEVYKLFGDSLKQLHQGEISWNGYEHNVLLMNAAGKGFHNIGYLLGVAFEFDGRGLISDDLDADGRPDLLVIEHDSLGLGKTKYHLHVLLNRLATENNWIGVRVTNSAGLSPVGAKVSVKSPRGVQLARIVTGDSFSSQHAPVAHFGLGADEEVEAIEITWANGRTQRLENPAVNRYHDMAGPAE